MLRGIIYKTPSSYTYTNFTRNQICCCLTNTLARSIASSASFSDLRQSERESADQELRDLEKQFESEVRTTEQELTRCRKTSRRKTTSFLPAPPDEKQTNPMRKMKVSEEAKGVARQGQCTVPTALQKEKMRKLRLANILKGELEFRTRDKETTIKLDNNESAVVEEIDESEHENRKEVVTSKAIGGAEVEWNEIVSGSNKEKAPTVSMVLSLPTTKVLIPTDERNPFWVKTSRPRNEIVTPIEWQTLKDLMKKSLNENAPILARENLDAVKRKWIYENSADWKTLYKLKDNVPWKDIEEGTYWRRFKKVMKETASSLRNFRDLKYLSELIGEQQNRLLNKYLTRDYDRSNFKLYPNDLREPDLWNAILESNFMLMMDSLQKPYYLGAVLTVIREMQRNNVHPITHLTALCHMKTESTLFLSAISRPRFIGCLINARLYEKRIAEAIYSRYSTGDFCFSNPHSYLVYLEYLSRCWKLSADQMLILTR